MASYLDPLALGAFWVRLRTKSTWIGSENNSGHLVLDKKQAPVSWETVVCDLQLKPCPFLLAPLDLESML